MVTEATRFNVFEICLKFKALGPLRSSMLRSSMVAGCNYFILWFQDLGNDQAIWVWQPSCEMLGKVGLKRQVQLRRMDTELDIWLMVSTLFPFIYPARFFQGSGY